MEWKLKILIHHSYVDELTLGSRYNDFNVAHDEEFQQIGVAIRLHLGTACTLRLDLLTYEYHISRIFDSLITSHCGHSYKTPINSLNRVYCIYIFL